jgi:creatinine amidohydrolase
MRISEMNWHQVAEYLTRDDRAVLPLGSTEQHAYLSLSVDSILSERVAVEAAAPVGVPVFPAQPYGITPYFRAYPGTLTLRVATYLAVVRDLLDGLAEHGFKRIVLVNGHGGNAPAQALADEWMADHPGHHVRFYNWWNAPRTWAAVQAIDPVASHASWMENFPWTRLAEVALPAEQKPMTDLTRLKLLGPHEVRDLLGDGNFGGLYERPDSDMQAIWETAVAETRAAIEGPWPTVYGINRGV